MPDVLDTPKPVDEEFDPMDLRKLAGKMHDLLCEREALPHPWLLRSDDIQDAWCEAVAVMLRDYEAETQQDRSIQAANTEMKRCLNASGDILRALADFMEQT